MNDEIVYLMNKMINDVKSMRVDICYKYFLKDI